MKNIDETTNNKAITTTSKEPTKTSLNRDINITDEFIAAKLDDDNLGASLTKNPS